MQTANAGTAGVSGLLIFSTGTASSGVSGEVYLGTGSSQVGNSGAISIGSGTATNGRGGAVTLTVGNGNSGWGGSLTMSAGLTTGTASTGGKVSIVTGYSSTASSGDMLLQVRFLSWDSVLFCVFLCLLLTHLDISISILQTANAGAAGVSGLIILSTGTASSTTTASGGIYIGTGTSYSSNSGAVQLSSGMSRFHQRLKFIFFSILFLRLI